MAVPGTVTTSAVSPTPWNHAWARATARVVPVAGSGAASSAVTSSIVRPDRVTSARTTSSPTGTLPSTSTVTRASRTSSRPDRRSRARTSSALGGPMCWASANHGPAVEAVASTRVPSSRSSSRRRK